MVVVGLVIYHKRHQLFGRDSDDDNELPAVCRVRTEEVVLVWSGLTILSISILLQVWLA